MAIVGVDVSHWQGAINWTALASRSRFAMIKLSEGTVLDGAGATNWERSRGKLPRAGYHYFHPTIDGDAQAVKFLLAMGTDYGEFGPCVDVETPKYTWTSVMHANLRACMQHLHTMTGRRCVIYTGGWYMVYIGHPPYLADHDLWLASYTANPPNPPPPWTRMTFWQYTSSGHGADYGVASANIDLNQFVGSEAEWTQYLAPNAGEELPVAPKKYKTKVAVEARRAGFVLPAGVEFMADTAPDGNLVLTSVVGIAVQPNTYILASAAEEVATRNPIFTASPNPITAGQQTTLAWSNTDGATGLYLNVKTTANALTGPSGTKVVAPSVTTTYTLIVAYPEGDVPKQVIVTVNPVPVPPPPTGKAALGLNCIGDPDQVRSAAALGATALLTLDHQDVARALKTQFPNLIMISRKWTSNYPYTGQQMADAIGGQNDGCWYTGYNECDGLCYGTQQQLRDRITADLDCARILRSRGVKYLMGGFSMGTPDFTQQWVIDEMKRYAPLYNSDAGIGFDMHLYSPNMNRMSPPAALNALTFEPGIRHEGPVGTPKIEGGRNAPAVWYAPQVSFGAQAVAATMDIWFEGRWRYLFTHCGFNPALRKIYCTETGVDEGGVGGFPAHQATQAQFEAWCSAWQAYQAMPVVVNGVSYPSPFAGACIFQAGNNASWAGYDVRAWIGSLDRLYWN